MYQIIINIKNGKNKETLEVIEETKMILQNPEEYQTYNDVDSMLKDILEES